MRRSQVPEPMLITSAVQSAEREHERRKRKYAITMSVRAACVLVAVLTYQVSMWLALAFVVGGMVLPWVAVVAANDGPARKREKPRVARPAGVGAERALTSRPHQVVDG